MSTLKQNRKWIGQIVLGGDFLSSNDLDKALAVQQHTDELLCQIPATTGCIRRIQLDDALLRQVATSNKFGEVLVEDENVASRHVKHGLRLQQRLVTAAVAALFAFSELTLSGCGSGGGGGPGAEVPDTAPVTAHISSEQTATSSYLTVTSVDYTLKTPTFYYSTVCDSFWSIQANIAKYVQDIDTRSIIRIDVPKIDGSWPNLNKVFSIETNPQYEKFPGTILVFNGSLSTMNKVEHGIISFTPDSVTWEHVNGTFEVTVTDYDSKSLPLPQYQLKGVFNFKMGEYGQAKT